MKITVFVVLSALLVASGFAAHPRITSLIEKCQSSPFGKTLMGTLELQLGSGSPGDYLTRLLNSMRDTVHNDIVRANATHADIQHHCEEDISALQSEIANHAASVIESNKIISQTNQKLAWDKVELGNNQRILAEAQDSLTQTNNIRASEANAYNEKINELNSALQVLHDGRNVIQNGLQHSASLVQISQGLNGYVRRMTALVQKKSYHGRGFVSLIKILAEIAQSPAIQANQESVEKVIGLVQAIIDEVEHAKNVEYAAEQERIANWEQIVEILTKRINEATNNINKLTNTIQQLEQIINNQKNRVADNVRSIQVKKRVQMKRKKECKSEDDKFTQEAKVREENLNLLDEALEVINEHIAEFRNIVLANSEANIGGSYKEQ